MLFIGCSSLESLSLFLSLSLVAGKSTDCLWICNTKTETMSISWLGYINVITNLPQSHLTWQIPGRDLKEKSLQSSPEKKINLPHCKNKNSVWKVISKTSFFSLSLSVSRSPSSFLSCVSLPRRESLTPIVLIVFHASRTLIYNSMAWSARIGLPQCLYRRTEKGEQLIAQPTI